MWSTRRPPLHHCVTLPLWSTRRPPLHHCVTPPQWSTRRPPLHHCVTFPLWSTRRPPYHLCDNGPHWSTRRPPLHLTAPLWSTRRPPLHCCVTPPQWPTRPPSSEPFWWRLRWLQSLSPVQCRLASCRQQPLVSTALTDLQLSTPPKESNARHRGCVERQVGCQQGPGGERHDCGERPGCTVSHRDFA